MVHIKKLDEFINEGRINEMGMAVRNANLANELAKKYKLKLNPTTRLYDCKGDVKVDDDLVKDGRLVIRFGTVGGDFICWENNLTTLEGAPQEVGGEFNCNGNNLTSLEGAPQSVGDDFYCNENDLTSLKGAPQKVGGDFYCKYNSSLIYDEANFYGFLPDVIGGELEADDRCDYELAQTYYNKK